MTNNEIHDRTRDLRRASNTIADRIDAIAEEVKIAKDKLGKRFRRIEEAVAAKEAIAEEPDRRVASAIDDFAAEARRSFERIVSRKRPRRFPFF
jgi:hypothetical protein